MRLPPVHANSAAALGVQDEQQMRQQPVPRRHIHDPDFGREQRSRESCTNTSDFQYIKPGSMTRWMTQ
jgi:hypothetical protein